MIFKKPFVDPERVKSKAKHVRDLTDYIRDPAKTNPGEEVLYAGARGFFSSRLATQQNEMIALAMDAPRSKNPIKHYILSWREGEYPTPQQIEQAMDVLLAEMGLTEHQAIYALHQDTDNQHLHVAVNRVHPDTLRVIKPNKGFDIEAGHRAIAKIEALQGWQSEQNARYQVEGDGVVRTATKSNGKRPSQPRRDMEVRTGEKSAERVGIEQAGPIIRAATSWADLHTQLGAQGMRYERKGSGAVLWVGDVAVKASSADRSASLAALQKRLGEYQAAGQEQPPVSVAKPAQLKTGESSPRWDEYIQARRAHYDAKNRAQVRMRERQQAERDAVSLQQREKRAELLAGNWKGRGEALNALRSLIAAQQASTKASMKDRYRLQREELQRRFRPFPSYEDWLRAELSDQAADQWRYRDDRSGEIPARLVGDIHVAPRLQDIRDYVGEVRGNGVVYRLAGSDKDSPAFLDRGRQVTVYDNTSDATILAAMQLSREKWGSFTVTGTDEYKAQCVRLAAQHGFTLNNPELQEALRAERERLGLARRIGPQPGSASSRTNKPPRMR
ncbi:relaxase/mobilization nuclease domain-containing protein [Pseudomonas stutzeri]|nr:relaxase/mobilization nuclease domain-containing protein [Stutzerimonas degradans]